MALTGVNTRRRLSTVTLLNNAPHVKPRPQAFIKFLLSPAGQAELRADHFMAIVSPATVTGQPASRADSRAQLGSMTQGSRSPRPLYWLGGLLVLYLGYPLGAFIVRVALRAQRGLECPRSVVRRCGCRSSGPPFHLLLGVLTGIPLAYVLAHRRNWLASAGGGDRPAPVGGAAADQRHPADLHRRPIHIPRPAVRASG